MLHHLHARAVLCILISAPTMVLGQPPCPFGWDPAFGAIGLSGSLSLGSITINDFHAWNNGPAPALYAAGSFTSIGGTAASGIARWNGTAWTALGSGLNGSGRAIVGFDDGSGPALFVGGSFSQAGGITVNGIAKWNGSAWSAVGGGMNAVVEDLAVFDDGSGAALYATGWFTVAGSVTTNFIARWNGTAWSAVGTGVGGFQGQYGRTLCVHDDGSGPALYVGGTFTFPYNYLVRWNGVALTSVGSGATASIESLVVHDEGSGPALYAGPQFFSPSSGAVRRWDGTAWNVVGSGLLGNYGRLFSFHDGSVARLLMTGLSVSLTGPPQTTPHFVQWDGTTWSVFGGGASSSILALGTFDDGTGTALYAGGYFSILGGVASNRIGRWWRPVPAFFLSQPGGPGSGVFVNNTSLVAGRTYQNVVSGDICPTGTGTGPWLGLCASDPAFIYLQVLLPLGAVPFHYSAGAATASFGPYLLPPGLTLEGLCFDRTGSVIGCVSPVQFFTVQ